MSTLRNHAGLIAWAFVSLSFSLVGCSSKDSKNNNQSNGACAQGETRGCLGPAACTGAQLCQADFSWSTCDCGTSGTGGSSATGGAAATSGGATTDQVGGSSSASVGGSNGTGVGGATSDTTGGQNAAPTGGASAATTNATGGTLSAPTGGATSNPVTGGATSMSTGGAAAAGGTTAAGGSSSSPYLVSTNGWITDTAHGVQGPVYTYTDDGGSNITPNCKTDTCFKAATPPTQFCVTGQVAKAVDAYGDSCQLASDTCDWKKYWGAAMAINLNQLPESTTPGAWDASKYTGISFAMTVNTLPANLRVYLNLVDGTQFCYQFTATKTYNLTWSQFKTDCYTTGGSSPTAANLTQVEKIAWQAGSDASKVGFFDFCVDQVKITQ